jgi:hypothetical protein
LFFCTAQCNEGFHIANSFVIQAICGGAIRVFFMISIIMLDE